MEMKDKQPKPIRDKKYGKWYDKIFDMKPGDSFETDVVNEKNNFISFTLCMRNVAKQKMPGCKLMFRTTPDGYIKFWRVR